MKFILLAVFVCVKRIQALAKCPTIPILDLEQVNLDQVIKMKMNRFSFFQFYF